jgi:hypothetical protein
MDLVQRVQQEEVVAVLVADTGNLGVHVPGPTLNRVAPLVF